MFSPYSPYGNGAAAAYNNVKGDSKEVAFWQNQLVVGLKRVDNVPEKAKKADWNGVSTELTSYVYNLRSAMLRLADYGKNPVESTTLAKTYFDDLNDMLVNSRLKQGTAPPPPPPQSSPLYSLFVFCIHSEQGAGGLREEPEGLGDVQGQPLK